MVSSRVLVAGITLLPGLLLLLSKNADAAGFAIKEQSAAGLGTAFAGSTASATEPANMFANPAALAYQQGIQAQAIASYIRPRAKLDNAVASNAVGTPLPGRDSKGNIAKDVIVPAFYGSVQLSEKFFAGIGINAPFGLETDYPDNWVGRYHALNSDLKTVNINPALALRPVPWLSVGGGVQIQYIDVQLTNAIDFGTITGAAPPGTLDGRADVKGDDWAYGFTLGALAEPYDGTRLGVGFRSEINHKINGDADFVVPAVLPPFAGGLFTDTGASAEATTPASVSFGVHQDITEKWAIMGEAQWTEWSSFDELVIEFDNPNQPDNVTEENWQDTWFFSLGTTYEATDDLTLRLGAAYDQSPVRTRFRTPRIPDSDRYWLATGLSWEPHPNVALDLSYTHIFLDDSDVRLSAADPGNGARGNLNAEYETDIDIIAVGIRLKF